MWINVIVSSEFYSSTFWWKYISLFLLTHETWPKWQPGILIYWFTENATHCFALVHIITKRKMDLNHSRIEEMIAYGLLHLCVRLHAWIALIEICPTRANFSKSAVLCLVVAIKCEYPDTVLCFLGKHYATKLYPQI